LGHQTKKEVAWHFAADENLVTASNCRLADRRQAGKFVPKNSSGEHSFFAAISVVDTEETSMSEQNLPSDAAVSELNLPPDALEYVSAEDAAAAEDEEDCACTLFAVVNANGTLARGFRAVSSQRFAVGRYAVNFNRNVRGCAYVATIGLSGSVGFSLPGQISVVGLFSNANGVFIAVSNSAGADADLGFHLAVHCRP
jgi:hypothetical protein